MNDRHPAGDSFPADPGADYSYAAYDTAQYEQTAYGSYGTTGYAFGGDGWSTGAYDATAAGTHTGGYDTGGYDTAGQYDATAYTTGTFDPQGYATGSYEAAGWDGHGTGAYPSTGLIPPQPGPHQTEQGWTAPDEGTAQWDVHAYGATGWDGSAYGQGYDPGAFTGDAYGTDAYGTDTYGTESYGTDAYGNGAYGTDAYEHADYQNAGWNDGYQPDATADEGPAPFDQQPTAAFPAYDPYEGHEGYEAHAGQDTDPGDLDAYGTDAGPADPYEPDPYAPDAHGTDPYEEPVLAPGSEAEPEPGAAAPGPQGRGRRRSPKPRRSALLTVAAPSVAVLGVAGISAASVLPSGGDEEAPQAAPDTEVKVSPVNDKLDTQLAGLREAGDDFADRASRTQERIDLKKRQEAERRRKAAEAARREALRPKFVLPVQGAGISAYFGQAGINWMSVHTGLDFPVSYGTPVKAATDGTVRTQWSTAYGNMIILTAPDGTETWYCHLSSTRIRAGSVKAGTVIGYSGNSGNSTGPHLHFEVRPGGGSAIDPLSWFRSHGLEPT